MLPAFDRVDSEIVISAGIEGVPAPPEAPLPPADEKQKLKASARADLPGAVENAKAYCLPYATGLGTFGAGVLVLGAGGFTGGVLSTAGSLMAAVSEPFCVATLERLKKDILTIYDPPDPHISAIAAPATPAAATMPSCAHFTGQNASFCQRLRPQLAALLAATQKVAGISAAIVDHNEPIECSTAGAQQAGQPASINRRPTPPDPGGEGARHRADKQDTQWGLPRSSPRALRCP